MKHRLKTYQVLFAIMALFSLALWLVYQTKPVDSVDSNDTSYTVPLLLGSFTTHPPESQRDGQGMYLVEFSPESKRFAEPTLLSPASNPSYAAISATGHIYTVFRSGSEDIQDTLNVFDWRAPQRVLRPVSSAPAAGSSPCYVALHPNETHVVLANYQSGNASVYALDRKTGAVKVNTQQVLTHSGSGPNANRQTGPHAHWAQWNAAGDRLYIVDLGIDKVMMYRFNPESGELGEAEVAFTEQPGAGPRHMVFHPRLSRAYLLNELNNTLTSLQVEEDGRLTKIKTFSTLPEDYEGPSQAAHIAINQAGTTLYTSNRGHNSIAVVKLDENGAMQLAQTISSGGNWPRHFLLLEEYDSMVVANVRSNNLALLKVEEDGSLTSTKVGIFAPKPNFVAALEAF